ncbi:hypothetical protein C1H46_039862 [Malus baccata]|uniref:Uncharacterized protein n=1 Tax=Malus baccata TaxID=106549 RepID=A0A540KK89_MALBA|nr:hypothetical protein C1H46_039862 [Malus baccata]
MHYTTNTHTRSPHTQYTNTRLHIQHTHTHTCTTHTHTTQTPHNPHTHPAQNTHGPKGLTTKRGWARQGRPKGLGFGGSPDPMGEKTGNSAGNPHPLQTAITLSIIDEIK